MPNSDTRLRKVLTLTEARAVQECANGCDVTGFELAVTLRKIGERTGKRYISIVPVMGKYPATERRPYFGCKATAEGLDEARRIVGQPVQYKRERKAVAK